MHKIDKEKLTKIIFYSLIGLIVFILYCVKAKSINERFKIDFLETKNYINILNGLKNTLIITFLAFLIGLILGMITCLVTGINSKNPAAVVLKQIFKIYVSIFRGTPTVVQLLIIYFIVFSFLPAKYSIFVATLAFGLNSGAYVSEIIRGGINAVPKGQMEAGRSLGLSYPTVMFKIILPQAIRNSIPSLVNEFITLIKETSIVGFIGAFDLTLAFRKAANSTYDYNFVYLSMGITYFVIIIGVTSLLNFSERKLLKYVNR